MRILGAMCAAAVVLAGCGGGGDDGPSTTTANCTFAGDYCSQVTGPFTSEMLTNGQAACEGSGGTFARTGCNTAGTVAGYCAYDATDIGLGAGYSGRDYYYTPAWDLASAQDDCTFFDGTWQN